MTDYRPQLHGAEALPGDRVALFIEARLGEAEQAARAATPGPWEAEDCEGDLSIRAGTARTQWRMTESGVKIGTPASSWRTTDLIAEWMLDTWDVGEDEDEDRLRDNADHIALNDPAHTLAWVAALRFIVAGHSPAICHHEVPDDEHLQCSICSEVMSGLDGPEGELVGIEGDWPCPTIHAIAGIWAGHEDWREEW